MVLYDLSVGHNNPGTEGSLQGKTCFYLGSNWIDSIVVGLKSLVEKMTLTDMNMPMWASPPVLIDPGFFQDANSASRIFQFARSLGHTRYLDTAHLVRDSADGYLVVQITEWKHFGFCSCALCQQKNGERNASLLSFCFWADQSSLILSGFASSGAWLTH